MKKQLHIKNHFVPECYLKRWVNTENRVFVYRTLVNHSNVPIWKDYSVSAIAYQKHLYTQIISGCESDELESWLADEFESPANEALNKVTSEHKISSLDWEVLIKFLAAQDVRTPAKLYEHVKRVQKELPEILQNIMNELKEKLIKGDLDDLDSTEDSSPMVPFPLKVTTSIDEGAEEGLLKAETYVGRSTWLFSIRHVLNNTRKILQTHKWTIVKPASGYFWPTSDNPVLKLNHYGSGKYDLKGGWDVSKGNIFFPIDPEHAMFVQIGDKPIQKNIRLTENQTKEFIRFIVENSHRKIFSHVEDNNIPLIRNRIVDSEMLKKENNEMKVWHKLNSEMEKEYIQTNKKI